MASNTARQADLNRPGLNRPETDEPEIFGAGEIGDRDETERTLIALIQDCLEALGDAGTSIDQLTRRVQRLESLAEGSAS
jgi:hypothetical protein